MDMQVNVFPVFYELSTNLKMLSHSKTPQTISRQIFLVTFHLKSQWGRADYFLDLGKGHCIWVFSGNRNDNNWLQVVNLGSYLLNDWLISISGKSRTKKLTFNSPFEHPQQVIYTHIPLQLPSNFLGQRSWTAFRWSQKIYLNDHMLLLCPITSLKLSQKH